MDFHFKRIKRFELSVYCDKTFQGEEELMKITKKILPTKKSCLRIHYEDLPSRYKIVETIERHLPQHAPSDIIIVCIGTDRSTGDALGPLIGTRLKDRQFLKAKIYGTLNEPVHAMNLKTTLDSIYQTYQDPFVIGIDACLGKYNQIGMVTIGDGPVIPGAGVNKKLCPVGDMHMTGIVNVSGYMEYIVLQNTRLSLVMSMANVMADSIMIALNHYEKKHTMDTVQLKETLLEPLIENS